MGGFDFKKLTFIMELKSSLQEHEIEQAQSKAASALKKSNATAFELFKTRLEQDEIHRRKYTESTKGDEFRARAACVESLEDWWAQIRTQFFG